MSKKRLLVTFCCFPKNMICRHATHFDQMGHKCAISIICLAVVLVLVLGGQVLVLVLGSQVLVLVLVLGGQVRVLVLVLGGQVLVLVLVLGVRSLSLSWSLGSGPC